MTRYTPAAEILPQYTDEQLKAERSYRGEAAAALLRVPAAYRHAVEVETTRRSSRLEMHGANLVTRPIRDHHEARLEVIAEVIAQLRAATDA